MSYRVTITLFFLAFGIIINAQNLEKDTTSQQRKGFLAPIISYAENTVFQYLDKSNQTPSKKAFDFSFIGGPFYSNETKIGLMLIGSGLFRLRGAESDSIPSNVSLYTNATTSGAYAFGLRGTIYFPGQTYWLNADISFSDTPSKYWGIGYTAGENNYYTNYNLQEIQIKADLYRKITRYASVGWKNNIREISGQNVNNLSMLDGQKRKVHVAGTGLNFTYDSRDVPTDAYRGMYIVAQDIYYPRALSNTSGFNKIELTFRYYKQLWKGSVIAVDVDGHFGSGDIPWSLLALVGNASQMRGYYTGRYRDNNLIEAQVELRQHIYKRSGAVVWAGGGNIFSKFKKIDLDETLPTFGVGYRFRLKPRTNLRFDYGFGKGQSAFYININEAF